MAQRVLADSRDALDRVAQALMERETLTLEEVEQIAGGTAGEGKGGTGRKILSGLHWSAPSSSE